MPNEIEGMTLPSRHPQGLYSAPALQGQEGAHTQQADAENSRQDHGIEDQVLAALEEAARASQSAPGYRVLATRLGRTTDRPIRSALAKLESQGRIRRIATPVGNRYEIPALGLITAPHRTAAPKPVRSVWPDRPPPTAWNHQRDNGLTEPQRQALSAARLEITQHGAASIVAVARRLGIADAVVRGRLVRVAGRGHLAQRADGYFILAEPATPASDGIRVEIRDGVRVTICPPRHADGALVFRQALSGGKRSS
jgi:hypothetical protein